MLKERNFEYFRLWKSRRGNFILVLEIELGSSDCQAIARLFAPQISNISSKEDLLKQLTKQHSLKMVTREIMRVRCTMYN